MRDEVTRNDRIDDDAAPLRYDDFLAYLPLHQYLFIPTRELWPAKSVDARLKAIDSGCVDEKGNAIFIAASAWLDKNRAVTQMTWHPGEEMLIKDMVIDNGGLDDKDGARIFNTYRPPFNPRSCPKGDVTRWLDHIEKLYGDATSHLVHWFAHRVQYPGIKINHAIVLGGDQGIGKDTILEPVRRAVGTWNCQGVAPKQAMGRFNKFLRSVLLVINEARDLGEYDRFAFYDHLKVIIAAPPDVLMIDEKRIGEYYIPNLCGVVITTNYKSNGIFLAADDRRHFVAWSERTKEDFSEAYWNEIWRWYDTGGADAIANYLATLDLSCFNPKSPPPKTEAFYEIVNTNRSSEDADLADLIDEIKADRKARYGEALGALTVGQLIHKAVEMKDRDDIAAWLRDRANRRRIPHRMEACGFVPVRNRDADDGLWRIHGKRQVIYARRDLDDRGKQDAAAKVRND